MREAVGPEAIDFKKIELLRTRSCLECRATAKAGGGAEVSLLPQIGMAHHMASVRGRIIGDFKHS
jgi:hypothetical protein